MIAVIGGGISGAFAAYFLARRGAAVTLIERDEPAAHASGNNPGGLNPLHGPGIPGPLQELALEAFRLHREHFSPPPRPRLQLAVDAADAEALERSKALYDSTPGFSARWLERDELSELEPGLDPAVRRGLWTEGNAKVDAADYTRTVVAAADADLVKAEVTGLRGTELRLGNGDTVSCDGIVIATGPWVAGPAAWLDVPLPVEAVDGELALVERGAPTPVDLAWRDAAVYDAGNPRAWLGGPAGGVARILPGLRDAHVLRRTRAPRPVTPDGLPIAGMVADNVCLALGGGRKGMLLSAALGLAAAELLSEGRTDLPIDPCSPERCSALSASAA